MKKNKSNKIVLSLALSGALAFSSMQFASASDLTGHWAQTTIEQMQAKGIIAGYENGNFKPNQKITRAEFIAIINKSMGFTESVEIDFKDVNKDDWFAKDLAIAVANGYIKGFPDGTFRPTDPVTRSQVAVMVVRAAKIMEDENSANKFTDSDSIPSWAKGSVGALLKLGYIKGYPDGSFGANQPMTRAEAAVSIYTTSVDVQAKAEEKAKQEEKAKEQQKQEQRQKDKKEADKNNKKKKAPNSSNSGSSNSGGSSSDNSNSGNSGDSGSGNSNQPAPTPEVEKVLSFELTGNRNISIDDGTTILKVTYHPQDASNKGVTWEIITGDDKVEIESYTDESATLKAKNDGTYTLKVALKSDTSVSTTVSGEASNQTVSLNGNLGTAGNSSISGLEAGKAYVLESEGQFYGVDANAKPGPAFDSKQKAILFSFKQKRNSTISNLDNTKTYSLIELEEAETVEFEDKIEAYINQFKNSTDDITLQNFKSIKNLTLEMEEALKAKDQLMVIKTQKEKTKHEAEQKNIQITKELEALNKQIDDLDAELDKIDQTSQSAEYYEKNNQLITAKTKKRQKEVEKAQKQKEIEALSVDIKKIEAGIALITQHRDQFIQTAEKVKEKIQQVESEFDKISKFIVEEIAKIQKPLKINIAKQILDNIDKNKNKISVADWKGIPDVKKYEALKADVEKYNALDNYQIGLTERGDVNAGLNADLKWNLIKNNIDAQPPVQEEKIYQEADLDNPIPNQLHEMRRQGVGKYKIRVTASFTYVEDKVHESGEQEVKLLENNLGTLTLDNKFMKSATPQQPQSDKIRVDFEKGYLEWDAIENATSYDVKLEMASKTQESLAGGIYLKPTNQEDDITNAENEFQSSTLKKSGDWYQLDGKPSTRVFAAIGLTKSQVSLNAFSPFIGNFFDPNEVIENEKKGEKETMYLKLWIIPRSKDSFYISDMKKYLTNAITKVNTNFIIENASFTETLKKFGVIK